MAVYMFTNRTNGDRYIGKTVQPLQVRLDWHKKASERNAGSYFHRALSKYGWNNFEIKVISETIDDELSCKLEIFLIDRYNTYRKGYNLTKGGDGTGGYKQSPEHIATRTASIKGSTRFDTVKRNKERASLYTYNGMTMDLLGWASYLGVKRSTLYSRLKRGKTNEEVFTPTVRNDL